MLPPILLILLAGLATLGRVFAMIGLTIVTGWFLGYLAAKNRTVESIFLSTTQTLEGVPIVTFFPLVLAIFLGHLPHGIGVELSVDFLVFTGVAWNIWVGQYEAIKTISQNLEDVANMFSLTFMEKMRHLYIPSTIPRTVANVVTSFAVGLFYITVSEVITVGTTEYSAFGIGTLIYNYTESGLIDMAIASLGVLVALVVAVTYFILYPLIDWSMKFTYDPLLTAPASRLAALPSRLRGGMVRGVRRLRRVLPERPLTPASRARLVSLNSRQRAYGRLRPRVPRYASMIIGAALAGLFMYAVYLAFTGPAAFSMFSDLRSHLDLYLYLLGLDYLRVLIVTVASLATAIVAAYVMAVKRSAESILIYVLETLASIPAPSYIPLIATPFVTAVARFLGFDGALESLALVTAYLSTVWYILYNTYIGVKSIPRELWELSATYRFTILQKMRYLVLPGAFPAMVTGLASTVGSTWGGLQLAEYIQLGNKYYMVNGISGLMDYYVSTGNVAGLNATSLLLAITIVALSVGLWRTLFSYSRRRFRMEGAFKM
ncbi:MAG: hypothetical protein AT710_05955 [Thermocladium sp. ECH_B]|nr:MAG: hypothetical protein AT710_05955 [Thermocladium sp. ECH_B]